MKIALLLLLLATTSELAKLPKQIIQCRRNDPDLNNCLKDAIEKSVLAMKDGIKSVQLLPIDPVAISRVQIKETDNRPVSLNLDITDALLGGITVNTVSNVHADLDNHKIDFEVEFDEITLDGNYVMDGKFLVLPVKGEGRGNATLTRPKVKLTIFIQPVTRDGEVYWTVDKFDVDILKVQNLRVHFENLFNGDKALGDATNKVLNDNWKEFWEEVKPAMKEMVSVLAKSVMTKVISKVPEKDIFL